MQSQGCRPTLTPTLREKLQLVCCVVAATCRCAGHILKIENAIAVTSARQAAGLQKGLTGCWFLHAPVLLSVLTYENDGQFKWSLLWLQPTCGTFLTKTAFLLDSSSL